MASLQDLKEVLKETLEERGILNEIRAKIRSEIFSSLSENPNSQKKQLSDENLIINEIIREYLLFNNYESTLSVFLPETGQPEKPAFDRSFLAKRLKILEDRESRDMPLIYSLCFGLKRIVSVDEDESSELGGKVGERKGEEGEKNIKSAANRIFNLDNPDPFSFKH